MSARALDYDTSQRLPYNKRRVSIKIFGANPLNNEDRPRYSEPKDAAQSLLIDTVNVLTDGTQRQKEAHWRALQSVVATGYLSTEKARTETENKIKNDMISVGASSQTLNDAQSDALMAFMGARALINQGMPSTISDADKAKAFEIATRDGLQIVQNGLADNDHRNAPLENPGENAALQAIYNNENWHTIVESIRQVHENVGTSEDALTMNAYINQSFSGATDNVDAFDALNIDQDDGRVIVDPERRLSATRQILASAGKFEPISRFEHDKATTGLLVARNLVMGAVDDPSLLGTHVRALTQYIDSFAVGGPTGTLSPTIQAHADQILTSTNFQTYQALAMERFRGLGAEYRKGALDGVIGQAGSDFNDPMANLDFVMTTRQEAEVMRHIVAFAVTHGPQIPSPEEVQKAAENIKASLSTPITARAPSFALRNVSKNIVLRAASKAEDGSHITAVMVEHPYWRMFENGVDKAPQRLDNQGNVVEGEGPILSQEVVIQASIFGSASYKMQFPTIAMEGENYYKKNEVIDREITKIADANAQRPAHERTALIVIADPNAEDVKNHSRTTKAILELAQAKGFVVVTVDAQMIKSRSRDYSSGEPRMVLNSGMSYTIAVAEPDTVDADGKTKKNVRNVPLYSTEGQRLARGSTAATNAIHLTRTFTVDGVEKTERLDPNFGPGKKIVAGKFYKNYDPEAAYNVMSTQADGSTKAVSLFTPEGKALLATQIDASKRTVGAIILIRPMDEDAVVRGVNSEGVVRSTNAEAKHNRLIGWQTSQSLAREAIVFGASRNDFNTAQIIRRAMESGKSTTVFNEAGDVMDPEKAMKFAKYGARHSRENQNITPQAFQRRESANTYPLSGDLIRVAIGTLAGQDAADRIGATANRLRRELQLEKPLTFGDLAEFSKLTVPALKAMTGQRGDIARAMVKAAGPALARMEDISGVDHALNKAWTVKNTTLATIESKTGEIEVNPQYRGNFYSVAVVGDIVKTNGGPLSVYAEKTNMMALTKPSLAVIGAEKQTRPGTIAPAIDAIVAEAAKKGLTISTVADETGALVIRSASAHKASVMVISNGGENIGLDRATAALLKEMIANGRGAYVTNDLSIDRSGEPQTVNDRLRILELAVAPTKTVLMAGAPENDPAVIVTARAGLNAKTMLNGGKTIATLSVPPSKEYAGNASLAQTNGMAMLRTGTGGVGLGQVAVGYVGIDGKFESEPRRTEAGFQTSPLHMIATWTEAAMTISSVKQIEKLVDLTTRDPAEKALSRGGMTARDIALSTGAARHPTPSEMASTGTTNDNGAPKAYEPDAWRKIFEEASGDGRIGSMTVRRNARVEKAMGL